MRIIDTDGRRDYYDIGQGLGQDRGVVYLRRPLEIKSRDRGCYGDGFVAHAVGFCGIIYPMFRGSYWISGKGESRSAWCYSIEDCDRLVESVGGRAAAAYADKSRNSKFWDAMRRRSWLEISRRSHLEMAFVEFQGRWASASGAFHEHNAPIVVWEPSRTLVNPMLRPYEFFRVKEPHTAFQELQQYVGGVLLANTKPVPIPDDETMRQIKGFDHKYSFRKEPKS